MRLHHLFLASALLALLGVPKLAHCDLFGPSRDTTIVLGYGYDPAAPDVAKQTPFVNLASHFESSGAQGVEYKLEVSNNISSSTQEQYFGAELQGRVGLYRARASLNLSSQRSMFKSAFVLNIYAKVDYGTEVLDNVSNANLNLDALALLNNPAGWLARYGPQVATRRRRGAMIVGSVVFQTSNLQAASSMVAQLQAAGAGAGWSASVSASLTNKLTEAIRSLNGSVNIVGYGGNGFQDLVPAPGSDVTDFQTWVNVINNYMSGVTQGNSAIIGYQTASYRGYINRASDPFTLTAADAYLRYISLQAKSEALTEFLDTASATSPWLNPDQIAAVTATRDLCALRADEAWDFGSRLVRSPKSILGRTLPADVNVQLPRILPHYSTVRYPNGFWDLTVRLEGAHRMQAWLFNPIPNEFRPIDITGDNNGTTFYASLSPNDYHSGDTLQFRFYDQNNHLVFTDTTTLL
ncbi:MAG: hypothetical protein K1X67_20025 [Fimbriimonadaceae bacterium]|nr:hypothetical protein [Fimbriimonadaceae bacterium]